MSPVKNYVLLLKSFFFLSLAILQTAAAYSQVNGCTDSLANNYNSLATINDGSCTYNITNYLPPIEIDPLTDTLKESSGLQMAGNFLWSFNDGGGQAAIYRIDTLSDTVLQRVYLGGAVNVDWEDIAFDGTHFYIGDFGNNANGARTNLRIYKFPYSSIPGYAGSPLAIIPDTLIETINFTYSDQVQPPQPTGANNTKFDCEAMVIDSGKIHLFTKNWIDVNTTHYVINSITDSTYIATPVETLATTFLVTAADKAIGQKIITLLGYRNSGSANHFMQLLSGYSEGKYFNGNKRRLDLPDVTIMGQAEGIAFRNGTYGYISNEKFVRMVGPFTLTVPQKLRSFDISSFVSGLAVTYTFTGNGNWDIVANWSNNMMPPATISAGSEIKIDPISGGECVLNIAYTLPVGSTLTVNTGKNFRIQGSLIQQ